MGRAWALFRTLAGRLWRFLGSFVPRGGTTIRLRLALVYGGLALVWGSVLLALTYTLLASGTGVSVIEHAGFSNGPKGGPVVLYHVQVNGVELRPNVAVRALPAPLAVKLPSGVTSPQQVLALLSKSVDYQRTADLKLLLVEGAAALAVIVVLAFAAGWIVAGRILRPLQLMTETARRLSAEHLGGRISLRGPSDELKRLADTFDGFLDRLDAAREAERRFVANASHELRTPLATQRTLLEVALSDTEPDVGKLLDMAGKAWQMNRRSRRLIEGLLELARSEQGITSRAPVDLAAVVRDAIEAAVPEAAALGLRIEEHLQPVTVSGDRVLLERMAGNLIENAVRHNAPGGRVEVSTGEGGEGAVLSVANTGPVVPASDVADLFEPFRRGGPDRLESGRGAGLGLSIVRAVARAHDGQVEATPRPGGGLTVSVTLPLG